MRQPVVENMMKALYFQFSVGVLPLYAVTFMGYWAYGSQTSTYLLNSVNGPVWVKTAASIASFLQTVIALHVYRFPSTPLCFISLYRDQLAQDYYKHLRSGIVFVFSPDANILEVKKLEGLINLSGCGLYTKY